MPILVVAKDERKRGFGRIFVDALTRLGDTLGCGLLIAWAAGNSMGFWARGGLHALPPSQNRRAAQRHLVK